MKLANYAQILKENAPSEWHDNQWQIKNY